MTGPLPTTGPDLASWAEHIADYVATFFAQNDVELPEARRIVPGLPSLDSWDCEQFSIGTVGLGETAARQGMAGSAPRTGTPASVLNTRQITYAVQIVRCVGECQFAMDPAEDAITAAGLQQLKEMSLLSQALVNLTAKPTSWAPKGVNAALGAITPLGPSGGMYAIEGSVTYSLMALMP